MRQTSPSSIRHGHGPRRQTKAFLRQFARVYSCAATLPPALGSFIAN